MFSLAKSPDTSIRRYEHNSNTITIIPSVVGMPKPRHDILYASASLS